MKPTVLVVDDDEHITQLLQDLLADDYNVVSAVNGYAALLLILNKPLKVDLIITDYDMPGLNGVELIENLSNEIPYIFITGNFLNPDFQAVLPRLHPVEVFKKPFSTSALRKVVRDVLTS